MQVVFTDPTIWNGVFISPGQQCPMFGGNGSSPCFTITDIPLQARALLVSFSDTSVSRMRHGGHGIVGVGITENTTDFIFKALPAETMTLPKPYFIVKPHVGRRGVPGGYLAPCSGGTGGQYYATIQAVLSKENPQILAQKTLFLGRY